MKHILVWHRRDLRTTDNAALLAATQDGIPVPVFVIDPFFFREKRETCDDRILFMRECLEDLQEQYRQKGSELQILYGNTPDVLVELAEQLNARVYYNFDTNMPFGRTRDNKIAGNNRFKGFSSDAIIRTPYNRTEWREHCTKHFQTPIPELPKNLPLPPQLKQILLAEIMHTYGIKKQKQNVPKGGTASAKKRLLDFLSRIQEYPRSISSPNTAENGCSRISAHLSFGCMSIREVYQATRKYTKQSRAQAFFLARLYWNQHFTQKMQDFPQLSTTAVNPVFATQGEYDEEKTRAWKEGRTGYPLVDASIRCLKQTGWINFRMRAMIASFYCDLLNQPWQIGADFMHYHLIDADTAINYAQWQMQAGVVGAHPPRIYNPIKQAYEQDPEGTFIKQWVPELQETPLERIHEPHKPTLLIELIPQKYPAPIIELSTATQQARNRYKQTIQQARNALKQPEIRTRASLSAWKKRT